MRIVVVIQYKSFHNMLFVVLIYDVKLSEF